MSASRPYAVHQNGAGSGGPGFVHAEEDRSGRTRPRGRGGGTRWSTPLNREHCRVPCPTPVPLGSACPQGVRSLGGATVLRLNYGTNSPVCALFVLPASPEAESLTTAANGLQLMPLQALLTTLRVGEVQLALPKFKAEWGTPSLVPALRVCGFSNAFDGAGVFLGMTPDPAVRVSDVLHKAVVEVNEEGTVAAALNETVLQVDEDGLVAATTTSVAMLRGKPPQPLPLDFDRPFLMLIVHATSGTPLFMGRFDRPNLN